MVNNDADDQTEKLSDGGSKDPSTERTVRYDAKTVKIDSAATNTASVDEEKTRVIGGQRRRERMRRTARRQGLDDAMEDPVSGWLVVVHGPGKGRSLALGYGNNSIGRGPEERLQIDFGDDQISRQSHAVVTYEARGRKFYVQQGSGRNLAYLNDAPVLTPTALPPLSHILIGNTTLRFVPLCGPEFDWQDFDDEAQ